MTEHKITTGVCGFAWGPMEVRRLTEIKGTAILGVMTEHTELEIRVSPTGRSVRVFRDGVELGVAGGESHG